MTQGRKGRYRCAVHVCVFLRSVCLCIRVCVLCICSAFAFFSSPVCIVRVSAVLSVLYTACPRLVSRLRVCSHWRLRSHIFFTTGVRVDVSVALQSPGLWRNAAYSARLSRPTDTNRAPLPASPSLSDAHTSLRGCIIFK